MSEIIPSFEIVPATALADVELLRPVLLSAVRNPLTGEPVLDDIEDILASVPRTEADMARKYTPVAISDETATPLGMMSLMNPDDVMRSFAQTADPAELTNAYVHQDVRGLGVGSALVRHIESQARSQGHSELLLNSGPRFMRSGWPFWRHQYGDPVGVAKDYYGPRFDAPVWRTDLTQD